MVSKLKNIPSVSEVLVHVKGTDRIHKKYLTVLIRKEISKYRDRAKSNHLDLTRPEIVSKIASDIEKILEGNIVKVINGTGIVLHTGFGRAPIAKKVLDETTTLLNGYVNLELNLSSGKRGDRNTHLVDYISAISNTESAIVVNNNAAAVLLSINTLARNKEVVVSRGQLVEIGGSFRIPDIIDRSSGVLKEVGSTNRTHLQDYLNGIGEKTGLILWVHTSNYKVDGFTKDVPLVELVSLGKRKRIPVMADLGSGVLMKSGFESDSEHTVEQIARTGVDIITYSGDKLLGGPQAGIIAGKKKLVNQLKRNSMYRALRCDKFTVTLLERSLMTYGRDGVSEDNLTHFLLKRDRRSLKQIGIKIINRAGSIACRKLGIVLVESLVEAGSGSMPVETIESMALQFNVSKPDPLHLAALFRECNTPVTGYIKGNRYFIDLKAIIPGDEELLISGIKTLADSI